MAALRAHSFFESVNWQTLWTDPAPPLEPGLVRREHPLGRGADQEWDDVGAAWDELVGDQDGGDDDDDGLAEVAGKNGRVRCQSFNTCFFLMSVMR